MSRQTTRAFAAGLATAALALWLYQQTSGDESLHTNELKRQLEEKNYIVLTAAEAEKLLGDKQATPAEEGQQQDESIENNTKAENNRQSNGGNSTKSEKESPQNDASFMLTITAGMSATEIGQTLEEAAIINSASQFSEYLTTNGYSTKVQVGQYKLSSSMTLKEIADTITKQ
ncbi:MAG TPA: endolytic transglycosylase MltG [Chondromyces sp.]|nr:endolytic transglycosylase MltG [Chondromyces sp.]